VLRQGKDVTLIGCGPLRAKPSKPASNSPRKCSTNATVINNPFINHVDLQPSGAAVQTSSGRVRDH
jgi:hypothetical protein